MSTPEQVLKRLSQSLTDSLGGRLLSLALHGSYLEGDFLPGRSDLDLVAILSGELGQPELDLLTRVHDQLVVDAPDWDGHVEVDYITPELAREVTSGQDGTRSMIRISPGEPIHLFRASRHYLINWYSALQHDRPIAGRPPSVLLPPIRPELAQDVILGHVGNWPEWVLESTSVGSQAYAVLTLCRADAFLATGRQLSKRAAARRGVESMPDRAELINWASAWWYESGSDDEPPRTAEVIDFVRATSAALISRADRRAISPRAPTAAPAAGCRPRPARHR